MLFPKELRLRARVIPKGLDWVSHAIAFYAIPIAIALISLAALFEWDDLYSARPEYPLDLHVLAPTAEELSVSDARQKLSTAPVTRYYNTHLSEQPIWFGFHLHETSSPVPLIVEFPSRHAVKIACWDGTSLLPLGDSSSKYPSDTLYAVKAGFALKPGAAEKDVICRGSFVGPARLSADAWLATNLDVATRNFHRQSGLIDGGLLMLAMFVLISGLFNRQSLYLLFAAWLVVTVRLSATSGGWDDQWLNHAVPADWLSLGRSFTRAAWALLTVTIFKQLFHEDLVKLRFVFPITVLQWLCMLLFVAAAFLPRSSFLPIMWVLGVVWVPFFIFSLARIIVKTRKTVAYLYAASLTVTLGSTFLEILAASFGTKGLNDSVSGVVVSLASCLLISMAIAEHLRQEHNQKLNAQAELQHTYIAMPIGLFTLDLQGRFRSANPTLNKMLGRHVLLAVRNTWQQYFGDAAWLQLYQKVHDEHDCELEIQSPRPSLGAESRRYLVTATLARDKIEGSLQDITEKSIATEELRFLANNDSLTKVLNRRGIEQAFETAVARINGDHALTYAYLDLDRFKLINDLYGHSAGDDVLKQVCRRITGMLSGDMRVGRVGGDEFVILLPNTRIPLATVICRGIVDSIEGAPFRVGDKSFHVRGSIGLIEIVPGTQMKDAMSTSDRACREAKAGQRKGLVVYERDAPAFKEHEAEIHLIERLTSSETIEGLFIEMQPILSLSKPVESLNFEVLLRMRDQAGELVPVSRVIAAGEHSGRMSVIDRWVLATTLAWLDKHQDRLQNTQFVCINLSGASWNDEEFMQEVFDLLRRNSHVVGFLCIEITESVALHDLENTRRFIDKVRSYGARVALDDFGAGYTSFSYLKELPADLLKIDGSFVVNMNQHPANVSIVEAIVNLARNLGMKTIAEWAEDAATVQTLAEIGVDYVQGYVVARPMATELLIDARSSAAFVKDRDLLQFISHLGQLGNPLAITDLMLQDIQDVPRKIH